MSNQPPPSPRGRAVGVTLVGEGIVLSGDSRNVILGNIVIEDRPVSSPTEDQPMAEPPKEEEPKMPGRLKGLIESIGGTEQ